MGYGVGVDLGTTWTAAAVMRAGEQPQMVSLGTRAAAVPTVVALQQDGTFAVGDAGVRRAVAEPDRVAREFKRRVGDTVPVLVAGQPWSPESLLSAVLGWVLARVAEQEGGPPDDVVVTHPANWGPLRRELLEQAAVTAGGVRARFVTEPEAAAVHYASQARVAEGTVVAVYDFGGGTFDATVLRKTADGFEILGRPEGIERLGGLDIDAALLAHVTAGLGAAWSSLDPDDPAARTAAARLRDDVAAAKEALSEDADVAVPIHLPTGSTEVRVTRGELEALIAPMIERSADSLADAIASAGLTPNDVDRILLVGGSSRIPLVSQILTTRFGRPLALDAHPKHAVALGAARLTRVATPVVPAPVPTWTAAPDVGTAAPPRNRRPLLIGAGAAAVAVLAGAALVLGGGGGDDGPNDAFCRHLRGLNGEVEDGALADEDGLDGVRDTADELGDSAESDEETEVAEAVGAILDDAEPADAEAVADDLDDAAVDLAGECALDASFAAALDAAEEGSGEVSTGPTGEFCQHVLGLAGEVQDGALATVDGVDGVRATADDLSAAADTEEQQGAADELVSFLADAEPTEAEEVAGEIARLLGPFAESCGVDGGEAAFAPPDDAASTIEPLAGSWFFDGVATTCTGLAEADCGDFFASFTSNVEIDCEGVRGIAGQVAAIGCTASIGTSEPETLTFDNGDGQLPASAGGVLPDADGFSCGGVPDPTTWHLTIETIDASGGDTTWTGVISLFSEDGAIDGNSCVEEFVVAEGTATLQ